VADENSAIYLEIYRNSPTYVRRSKFATLFCFRTFSLPSNDHFPAATVDVHTVENASKEAEVVVVDVFGGKNEKVCTVVDVRFYFSLYTTQAMTSPSSVLCISTVLYKFWLP
jgi:hypothetical protein